MWPFATRGSRFLGNVANRHPSHIHAPDFVHNDAVVKLWLPERMLAAIDVLCDEHDASRPDVLRWLLFEHAYGRAEFAHLCRHAEQAAGVGDKDHPDIRYSRQSFQRPAA